MWRDGDSGELSDEGLKELALDALSSMEPEEYEELVAGGNKGDEGDEGDEEDEEEYYAKIDNDEAEMDKELGEKCKLPDALKKHMFKKGEGGKKKGRKKGDQEANEARVNEEDMVAETPPPISDEEVELEGGEDEDEDEELGEEPQEEDLVYSPSGQLGSQYTLSQVGGGVIGTYSDDDEVYKAAKKWGKENQFFPDIWFIDDHGGATNRSHEAYKDGYMKEARKLQEAKSRVKPKKDPKAAVSKAVKSAHKDIKVSEAKKPLKVVEAKTGNQGFRGVDLLKRLLG